MFRFSALLVVLLLAVFTVRSSGEQILQDTAGNGVYRGSAGGTTTNTLSDQPAAVSTCYNWYTFYVYVNSAAEYPGISESFFVQPASNDGLYGSGHLVSASYSASGNLNQLILAQNATALAGTASQPNTAVGTYAFTFVTPASATLQYGVYYTQSNTNAGIGLYASTNQISVTYEYSKY